jgi:hypothetical protein
LTRSATRPGLAAAVGASTRLVAQAFFPAIQLRPAGPRYPAAKPSSQPEHHPRPWPCWRMRAGRRGDRVELTIGPGSSEAVSPRPSHHLPVPSLVDRAAPSGVVPGEPGGAAVLGAGSGFAEGAHHRSGAGGAASAIAHRHSHACIVPPPKQGKRCSASPYPAGRGRCGRVGSVAACRVSARVVLVAVVGLGWLAVTELLARVGGSSVTANCPAPTKEAAMSTWLWVLIIVVVLVLVFGVMRRRRR